MLILVGLGPAVVNFQYDPENSDRGNLRERRIRNDGGGKELIRKFAARKSAEDSVHVVSWTITTMVIGRKNYAGVDCG